MKTEESSPEIPGGYHAGSRELQDHFDSRRIADRLEDVNARAIFTEGDRAFISAASMFFLATANEEGWPECSYKGGLPGFVRVTDECSLAFPDYDGNGMFRSLGNVSVNPRVGLLFVNFEKPSRLRLNGLASVHLTDPLLDEFPGAQCIVRVRAERIFPNCPRYIHRMQLVQHSVYAPGPGLTPPEPDWKHNPQYADALPKRLNSAPES
ncbi:MAG: pyridoxamine 5'-phosphate oxidase family protein [Acidobacteriota bacterium]